MFGPAEKSPGAWAAGIPFDIVPGVTSAIAAPALAGIPVTHRGVASAFLVASGHDESAFAETVGQVEPNRVTLVVLMGLGRAAEISAQLIDRGWARNTPAAAIVDASTPRQETWYGLLHELAAGAANLAGEGPGIIVVGQVAALRLVDAGGAAESIERHVVTG